MSQFICPQPMEECQPSLPTATTSNPFNPTALVVPPKDRAELHRMFLPWITSGWSSPSLGMFLPGLSLTLVQNMSWWVWNLPINWADWFQITSGDRVHYCIWCHQTNPTQIQRESSYHSCSWHAFSIGYVCIYRRLILYKLFYLIGQWFYGTDGGIYWHLATHLLISEKLGHIVPFFMLCSCPFDQLCRQRPHSSIHGLWLWCNKYGPATNGDNI